MKCDFCLVFFSKSVFMSWCCLPRHSFVKCVWKLKKSRAKLFLDTFSVEKFTIAYFLVVLCLLSKNFFVCKKQELLHRISSLHWEKGVATNILCFSGSHSKSLWPPLVHSLLSRISWSPAVKKVLPYLYREGKYSFPEELWWWLRLSY